MIRAILFSLTIIWTAGQVAAQAVVPVPGEVRQLYEQLRLPEVIDIMRVEGMRYGDDMADEMFAGRRPGSWPDVLAGIYESSRMQERVLTDFAKALEGVDLSEIRTFFDSELGQDILELEIAARQALQDEELEQSNDAVVAEMRKAGGGRLDLLTSFIEVNDLLEENLRGSLQSNYQFFNGLVEGGAMGQGMDDGDIRREVWAQEPEIRADTLDWLYGFLTLAYSPLTDKELQAYILFSKTDAGQAMNRALYDGFDPLFNEISGELGRAAAAVITSKDL